MENLKISGKNVIPKIGAMQKMSKKFRGAIMRVLIACFLMTSPCVAGDTQLPLAQLSLLSPDLKKQQIEDHIKKISEMMIELNPIFQNYPELLKSIIKNEIMSKIKNGIPVIQVLKKLKNLDDLKQFFDFEILQKLFMEKLVEETFGNVFEEVMTKILQNEILTLFQSYQIDNENLPKILFANIKEQLKEKLKDPEIKKIVAMKFLKILEDRGFNLNGDMFLDVIGKKYAELVVSFLEKFNLLEILPDDVMSKIEELSHKGDITEEAIREIIENYFMELVKKTKIYVYLDGFSNEISNWFNNVVSGKA